MSKKFDIFKTTSVGEVRWSSSTNFDVGNVFIAKKFDKCKILLKKFDIYSKIFFRDVGNFFRHLCELVLRHQMRVSNYFVNSFYSVACGSNTVKHRVHRVPGFLSSRPNCPPPPTPSPAWECCSPIGPKREDTLAFEGGGGGTQFR